MERFINFDETASLDSGFDENDESYYLYVGYHLIFTELNGEKKPIHICTQNKCVYQNLDKFTVTSDYVGDYNIHEGYSLQAVILIRTESNILGMLINHDYHIHVKSFWELTSVNFDSKVIIVTLTHPNSFSYNFEIPVNLQGNFPINFEVRFYPEN